MSKKTIMLVCSAGMSTSLFVTKMQKAAFNQGLDAHIFAASASEADTNLENNPVDVLLLGPQVRYMKSDFEKRLSPKGIPTDVISMSDYGLMNGEKVLEQALDLLAQADKKE
ncbi:PTS sugar transporter subunit IIB [Enterococcus faecalis ATCC 29212]